ncbi:MAG: ABC-F family ATP-binding cassette domain-containing protein [Ignavibacteriae bacterium]|nr:ABC-F family ATP-binding cassette domain-containing protein [Ignavibacteriota bacterium]MCB9243551.1 ABC-F family ATP-binding cassette domain-containing protein [Ignavibacteriales bacterium]
MIALNNISVNFGTRSLFEEVSLRVSGKDRIAFIGSNGAGKSTLMKIIAGLMDPDTGDVVTSKHTTIGYLPQDGIKLTGNTLYDEVYSSAGDINKIQQEIEDIEMEMESFDDHSSEEYMDLLTDYTELQERFSLLDGHKLKAKIERILTGLGFSREDFERMTDEFSGGWQMRIALAKLLLQNPSVLLLDEPTNHLDIESLIWVEDYLKSYEGSIILISHDRNFLDNLVSRVVEISLGKVTEYSGNYSYYVSQKELRKEQLQNQLKNQEKYIKQQERFIERFRYKNTKAKAVQSRIKMLDRMEKVELEDEESGINFHFPPATHSGKVTLEIEDLTKTYDGSKYVLDGIDLLLERGEKVAFLGVNGAGKSTLSKIIAGKEHLTAGRMKFGHLVDVKFYSQNQADELDEKKTVLEIMEDAATGEVKKNLRTLLGGFLFRDDDVFKPVKVLSGGEKSRLALAKMLIEPSNFLILDEPTNHLDMRSKDMLKNALRRYDGTIIVVSHDREFLDGIVDKVIEVKDKKIRTYLGNCAYYLMKKEEEKQSEIVPGSLSGENKPEKKAGKDNFRKGIELKERKKEINKILSPVKKKISEIEETVKLNEARIRELEKEMASADFYNDPDKVKEVTKEYNDAKEDLDKVYAQWEDETLKLNELQKELSLN